MDPYHLPCFIHNSPACGVGYWKDALICLNPFGSNVFSETVSYFLRNEHDLPLFSTLGSLEGPLPIFDVSRGQLEDLANSHPSPGHQLKNQSVSGFDSAEYHFIYDLLFENGPPGKSGGPIEFFQHGCVAWASEIGIEVLGDEVEE